MAISLIVREDTGQFDFGISNGQLITGNDYATLFAISLFSCGVKVPSPLGGDVPLFDGYWGNSFHAAQFQVGSALPLLLRGVRSGNGSILGQAKDYAYNALQGYLTLGIITSLNVTTYWLPSDVGAMGINITYTKPTENTPQLLKYGLSVNDGTAFLIEPS